MSTHKTKAQLVEELETLRGQVATLKEAEEERKQAEEALQKSEESFRNLFNDVPLALYESTPEGRLTEVNPAFVEMLGYPDRETLLATPAPDLYVAAGERDEWKADLEGEETLLKSENRLRRYDSEVIWVRGSTRAIRDETGQIAYYRGSIEDITERKQAELIQQTSTAAIEINASIAQTAERAENVAQIANRSVEVSQQGQQAVAKSIEGMNLIRQRVEGIAETILALSKKTQQIGEIIATVNDIAEQSKLLGLNASIEAARAGKEGRGFAVVAMEMRNLAEQSREATLQVRDILNEIRQATDAVVSTTEGGIKGVQMGESLIDEAGQTIQVLTAVIQEAAELASQIAVSTRQQSTGAEQLAAVVQTMRETSQHNAE
jgi:PAS domain S-box-containing protein